MTVHGSATCCWCGSGLVQWTAPGVKEQPWVCPTPACAERQWALALCTTTPKGLMQSILYLPTPKQAVYHTTGTKRRMYGGAAGGAKSHGARWDAYRKAMTIPGYTGLILRRTMPELKKTHLRAFARDAEKIGAEFLKSENQLKFPQTDALIECGHCEDDDAVSKYLSTEYDDIKIDEGSTFEEDMLLELSTRARTSNAAVKAAGGAWFDVLTNPGGRSWALLRDLYVTHEPDFERFPALRRFYRVEDWTYIKALLDDNPYLDDEYETTLAVLGDARYRQLRYGEEFVTDGQFFGRWRETMDGEPWHVRDLELPEGVEYFGSMDWGYNAPGVMLWWACLPDGHYHIVAEYKFRETSAEDVAREIRKRTADLKIERLRYIACDPSMKAKTGSGRGESIMETLQRLRLPMRASDNDRINGWLRCQQLLREAPDGTPWLTLSETCTYGRRTIPAMVQDEKEPDDLDTHKDDHWVDAWRYGAMSRPAPTRFAEHRKTPPAGSIGAMLAEMLPKSSVLGVELAR